MSLAGQLAKPRKQYAVDARPGVPGVQITDLQKRGVPFTLRSIVDCASYPDGVFTFNDYLENALDQDLVDLVQSDYSTAMDGWRVKVLDCRQVSLQKSATIVGGLQYTSGAILICEWDLIGQDIS